MDNNFQREACKEEQSESQSQNRPSEEVRADLAPSGLGSDVHHRKEVRADAPSGFGPTFDQSEGLRADPVIPPSGMGSDVGQECVILQNQVLEASSDPNQTDVCAAQASQTPHSTNQTNINPAQTPNTSNPSVSEQRCPERAKRIRIRNYGCQKRQRREACMEEQSKSQSQNRPSEGVREDPVIASSWLGSDVDHEIKSLMKENEYLKIGIDELKNEMNELLECINKLTTEPPNRVIESPVESNHQQGGTSRGQTNSRTAESSRSSNSIHQTNVNSAQAPSTSHAFVSGQRWVRSSEAERTESESDQDHLKRQKVLIKQCASKVKAQAHVRELEEEGKLFKNLSHPNIVEEETLNILLEFAPGGSISSLLGKFGPFPEPVIRTYIKQLLLGLEYLHKNGIMHMDIKGANILVDNKGSIKLADFGASKQVVELSMKGTPYWMAPEVILQTRHSFSADIWSVGCTVIEMATGKPPWSQQYQEVAALFHVGTTKSHPPIPEYLSIEAKDFLLKCLQKEPELRPVASELLKHSFVTGESQDSDPLLHAFSHC